MICMKQEVVLSGIKATGDMHIGNYFGAIKQWVDAQDQYEKVYIFIPDYHSIISVQDKNKLEDLIFSTAVNLLAVGIDPKKVIFFKQSDMPHHTEATWIFNCLMTMPQLMRAHAFKDSEAKDKDVSVGLFDYPVLQAADILLYDATTVPVGEDQRQHIEMARDIARKFNNTYGELFVEPQALVKESVGVVPGDDGRKMSKSYGNQLALFATEAETEKYIKGIAMDSKDIDEKKNPDDYSLYKVAELFLTEGEKTEIRAMFENGGVGYGDIKMRVAEIVNEYLRPMRERREELLQDRDYILQVLEDGAQKAGEVSLAKIKKMRQMVGLELK